MPESEECGRQHDRDPRNRGRPQLRMPSPLPTPKRLQPALQQDPKQEFFDQRRHDYGHRHGNGDRTRVAAAQQLFRRMGQCRLLIGRLLRGIFRLLIGRMPRGVGPDPHLHGQRRPDGKTKADEEEEQHVLRLPRNRPPPGQGDDRSSLLPSGVDSYPNCRADSQEDRENHVLVSCGDVASGGVMPRARRFSA